MRTLVLSAILLAGCAVAPPAQEPSTSETTEPAKTPAQPVATPARLPQTIVEGKTFAVAVSGSGPDVLLIPGLTCGGHVWDETVTKLERDHRVHVLTLSGFAGRPAIEAEELLPAVRDELTEYIRRENMMRPVVVGHSLGGFMALWLAVKSSDEIAGAVAVDGLPSLGALSGQEPEAVAAFAAEVRSSMAHQSQEDFAEQTSRTLLAQITDPTQAANVAQVSGASDPATVGQAMAELLTTDLRPQLGGVGAPVLLLGASSGTADQQARVKQAYQEQVSQIPTHEVIMVPDTRHFVMLDAPEAFEGHLLDFLESVQ